MPTAAEADTHTHILRRHFQTPTPAAVCLLELAGGAVVGGLEAAGRQRTMMMLDDQEGRAGALLLPEQWVVWASDDKLASAMTLLDDAPRGRNAGNMLEIS